jgi:hypothetical protein
MSDAWKGRTRGLVFAIMSLANYAGIDWSVPSEFFPTVIITVNLTEMGIPTGAEAAEAARIDALGGNRLDLQ